MQKKFKILFLIFIFSLASFILSSSQERAQEKEIQSPSKGSTKYARIGALAPDFITEDVYGNEVLLSNFRSKKPVLLAFWATWCSYCTKELPGLKAFVKKHQDQIQVMAVVSGESRKAIMNYIKRKNVNFLMLLDEDRKIWNQYLVMGTPIHFLLNEGGKIITRRIGYASKKDLEVMLTLIRE